MCLGHHYIILGSVAFKLDKRWCILSHNISMLKWVYHLQLSMFHSWCPNLITLHHALTVASVFFSRFISNDTSESLSKKVFTSAMVSCRTLCFCYKVIISDLKHFGPFDQVSLCPSGTGDIPAYIST